MRHRSLDVNVERQERVVLERFATVGVSKVGAVVMEVFLELNILRRPTGHDEVRVLAHMMVDDVVQLAVVVRGVFNANLQVLDVERVAVEGKGVGETERHVGLLVPVAVLQQNWLLVVVRVEERVVNDSIR